MNKKTQNLSILSGIIVSSLVIGCSSNQPNKQTKLTNDLKQPIAFHLNKTDQSTKSANPSLSEIAQDKINDMKHSGFMEKKKREQMQRASQQRSKEHRMMQYSPSPVYQSIIPQYTQHIQNNENYAHYESNKVIQTKVEPVSTFSIDVDTGSYSNMRRLINSGHLPVRDAIRTEELINYFSYNIAGNNDSGTPFNIDSEVGPSPWSTGRHLLKIGIKAVDVDQQHLPSANLVFLIDVSGSMNSADKLGLLKKSLSLLVSKLRQQDSIAIVVYAGASGVVLEPTSGDNNQKIIRALENLSAGGSTNGASGIRLAYQVAQQAYIKGGINRILLATDGDFNVGTVNFEQLKNLVEEKRKTGISLSTIGFGTGNYNDQLMEQLADAANGKYSYIDNLNEAQKVLVDELSSSLKTVAKDGKIQIEFNPEIVSEYRLIGYENRKLNKEDFNNDKVDAGDIGAGDSVTALYEIVLSNSDSQQIDSLRYQHGSDDNKSIALTNEIAFVKVRYKKPQQSKSQLVSHAITKNQVKKALNKTSDDFRFAAAVAGFAELLKGGKHQQSFGIKDLITLSSSAKGEDKFGYRHEFIQLIRLAESLQSNAVASHTGQ